MPPRARARRRYGRRASPATGRAPPDAGRFQREGSGSTAAGHRVRRPGHAGSRQCDSRLPRSRRSHARRTYRRCARPTRAGHARCREPTARRSAWSRSARDAPAPVPARSRRRYERTHRGTPTAPTRACARVWRGAPYQGAAEIPSPVAASRAAERGSRNRSYADRAARASASRRSAVAAAVIVTSGRSGRAVSSTSSAVSAVSVSR